MTVKATVTEYFNELVAVKGITAASQRGLRQCLLPFSEAHRDLDLSALQSPVLTQWLAQWAGYPRKRRNVYIALRAWLNWCVKRHYIRTSPIDFPCPVVPDRVLPVTTPELVHRLLEACQTLRDRCVICVLADTGLRRSEIALINVVDVELSRGRIVVELKGGIQGYAVLGPQTRRILDEYIAGRRQGSLFGLTHEGIYRLLKRLEARTGIPVTAHAFRRGFACSLRRAGVDLLDIKDLGRWKTLVMVQHYTRSVDFDDAASRYVPIVRQSPP